MHCYEKHLSSFFVEIVEMKTSKATLKGDLNFKSNILTYKSKWGEKVVLLQELKLFLQTCS